MERQAEQIPLVQDREKSMLSNQTVHGIEMAIRGFTSAVRYLLKQGAKFVMASRLGRFYTFFEIPPGSLAILCHLV